MYVRRFLHLQLTCTSGGTLVYMGGLLHLHLTSTSGGALVYVGRFLPLHLPYTSEGTLVYVGRFLHLPCYNWKESSVLYVKTFFHLTTCASRLMWVEIVYNFFLHWRKEGHDSGTGEGVSESPSDPVSQDTLRHVLSL